MTTVNLNLLLIFLRKFYKHLKPNSMTYCHEMDYVCYWVHRIQFIVPFIKCGKYASICYTFFSWRIFFELPEKTPIRTAHGPTLRRGVGNTIFAARFLVRCYEIIVIINIFVIIVTTIIIIIIFCFSSTRLKKKNI